MMSDLYALLICVIIVMGVVWVSQKLDPDYEPTVERVAAVTEAQKCRRDNRAKISDMIIMLTAAAKSNTEVLTTNGVYVIRQAERTSVNTFCVGE